MCLACVGETVMLDMPMLADELEVLYCVFDIIVLDGETLIHLPLYQRHQKLQHALRATRESVPLEHGQTVITGRVVAILPDQAEPPVPGYPRSSTWSMCGRTIQDIMVRSSLLFEKEYEEENWSPLVKRFILFPIRALVDCNGLL
jgi:hypothetical protein